MPTEQLEYRFEESGLDQLRSDMADLASGTEDVGDAADTTASDLEDMADTGAADGITRRMENVEESLQDVADEATDTGASLEQGLDVRPVEDLARSTAESEQEFEQLRDRIMASSDALSGLQSGKLSLGGGSGGGGLTNLLGAVGVSQLEGIQSQLSSMPDTFSFEFEGLEELKRQASEAKEETEELERAADSVGDSSGPMTLADDFSNLDQEAEEAGDSTEDLGNQANALGGTLQDLDFDGMLDGIGGSLDKLPAMGGNMSGLATKAMGLVRAMGPVKGTILAAGAAAATQAPKFARLSRELQTAAAAATELPSKIQQVTNAQELLTGRSDPQQVGEIFKEFELRMREAQEGAQEAQEGFNRLDISMSELGEMTPNEAFNTVIRKLRQTSEEQKALTMEQVFGGQAAEQFALMTALSAEELERLNNAVEETTFSDQQIAAMASMGREMDSIGQRMSKLGGDLLTIFEPVFTTILKLIDETLRGITWLSDKIANLVQDMMSWLEQLRVFSEGELTFNFKGGEGTDSEVSTDTGETGSNPRQRMGDTLNGMSMQIARIRQRKEMGLINTAEMRRQIASARQSAFQEMQKLAQQAPDLVTDELISHLASELKKARARLEQATRSEVPGQGVSAAPAGADPASTTELPSRAIDPSGLAADMQQRAANMRRAYEDELSGLKNFGEAVGQSLTRSISRSVDRAFSALGQGITDAIFGTGGPSTAQSRLQLFNAKDQVRSMKASLRKGQMSYRKFSLKMQAQQKKIQKRQDKLNESMQSGFAKAADTMVDAFKKAARQLISEVIAVIIKMAVLKAITAALGMGGGGIGGAIVSQLGGGAFLDSGASGGMVKSSGLAEIHEDEQIMNAETVSMLDNLLQPSSAAMGASTSSFQPAAATGAGGGMNLTVQVQGETTTDGRDLKTSYDQTTRIQRRKGRRD